MVWHNSELFEEMKKTISCDLEPVSISSGSVRIEWFTWLAATNKEETAYNIHALWLWYFKAKIHPFLPVSSSSPSPLATFLLDRRRFRHPP